MSKTLPPATRCFLRCRAKRHEPIELKSDSSLFLGRSPDTQIRDVCCSRNQVSLDVDLRKRSIKLKQLGTNPSGLNGFSLIANQNYTVYHGDIVEVLHGQYLYEVCFEPPPPADVPADKSTVSAAKCQAIVPITKEKPVANLTAPAAKLKSTDATSKDEATAPKAADKPIAKSAKDISLSISASKKRTRTDSPPEAKQLKPNSSSEATATGKRARMAPESKWDKIDGGRLLIYTAQGVQSSERIAAYDIDGTIIRTKSGNVFPKNGDDWQLAYPQVAAKLAEYHHDGFKIAFFTNQAGMATGRTDEPEWRRKCEQIVAALGVPVQVFVATGASVYRKPKTGMWDTLKSMRNDGLRIDRSRSLYVGDAAGRPAVGKRRKDHSLADRLFALNVDVPFQTPEEHFLGAARERFTGPEFLPGEELKRAATEGQTLCDPADAENVDGQRDLQLVLMVGAPGSGKSHVAEKWLATRGFQVVNQDRLKTWQKCVAVVDETLQRGCSVVVDNTNMDAESRLRYVAVARKRNVQLVRCFIMDTSMAHCRHNIAFRELVDPAHSKIPERLLVSMRNKYKEPHISEGFTDIVRVRWIPRFDKKSDEQLYRMFLLEK